MADHPFQNHGEPLPHDDSAEDDEAVFGARNPSLLIRSEEHLISFRDGEYRTSHPGQIALLQGVVNDEARGNKGVWLKQAPRKSKSKAAAASSEEAPSKKAKD